MPPAPGKEAPLRAREANQTAWPTHKSHWGSTVSGAPVQLQRYMGEDSTVLAEVTSPPKSGSRDPLFPTGHWDKGAIAVEP